MNITLTELAQRLGAEVIGDGSTVLSGAAPLHLAGKNQITFLTDVKRTSLLDRCQAGAVVVASNFSDSRFPLLRVSDVKKTFEEIALLFHPPRTNLVENVSPFAFLSDSVQLGKDVKIGSYAVLGKDVKIGDGTIIHAGVKILDGTQIGSGCVLFPNAVIYENCVIGDRCILHANCSIGAYGFGYDSSPSGHQLSLQIGNVVLENDVEIGANSTVDRGTYDSTVIGEGTKIDNLVMIAHNCRIGRFNLICAHTGVAGSCVSGDFVVMAGRVGIRDHIRIGDGAVLGAMAGIMVDIPEGARVVGIPATPEKEQMRIQVALAKLPELRKEHRQLQEKMEKLQKQLDRLENNDQE